MTILRILISIFLLLSVFFIPWYIVAIFAIVLSMVFSWFWESILAGIFLGSLYSFLDAKAIFLFFIISFSAILFTEECAKNFIQQRNLISNIIVVFSGGLAFFLCWLVFKTALYF